MWKQGFVTATYARREECTLCSGAYKSIPTFSKRISPFLHTLQSQLVNPKTPNQSRPTISSTYTMPPTTTTNRTSFTRPLPSSVTYTLPSTPFAFPVVTITIPPHSTWTSGLHFHAMHTEYLSVVKGTALVTLDGVTNTYTSSDGIITVPRYMKHEWQRGDKGNGEDKDELVVKEWTDPEDGEKEIFFRNLNSAILDATSNGLRKPNEWMLTWQLFTIFWQLDNFPLKPSRPMAFLVAPISQHGCHALYACDPSRLLEG
ncbi:hypothetical protein BGZ60DRAFT_408005 [Tricladium varicosporioides]|nr:hypothetical protein BGZ60DRAFT_408005 [Hymenoscyphus varicosporioides]